MHLCGGWEGSVKNLVFPRSPVYQNTVPNIFTAETEIQRTKQNKSESETTSDIVATLLIRVEQCLQNPKFGFLPRILYTKPKYLLDT